MKPRYVLAKYVPDLGRMEPRNIGVFLWWKGTLCAKFLEQSEVNVNDPDTFQRWKTYWTRLIREAEIRPRRGKPVDKKNPSCVDALLTTQKGNYILVESGELLHNIKKKEIEQATEYLFEELVAPPGRQKGIYMASTKPFAKTCEDLLQKAGVVFKDKEPVECTWNGVRRHLHPDYYIGNGAPEGILQRANVSNEISINGAAVLIELLLDQAVVQQDQCRILVREQHLASDIADEGMKQFARLCEVVNVDSDDAEDRLRVFSPEQLSPRLVESR